MIIMNHDMKTLSEHPLLFSFLALYLTVSVMEAYITSPLYILNFHKNCLSTLLYLNPGESPEEVN